LEENFFVYFQSICLVGSNPSHLIKSNVLHNNVRLYCRPDKWCFEGNEKILCPLYSSICNNKINTLCLSNDSINNVRIEQGVPGLKHWQLSGELISFFFIKYRKKNIVF
jgi:hypothetical protein